ncbi:MAG: hypothetical protein KGZ39_00300 [Simkania sp.]|nr:hypothetical protein [Simkania sp.]
MSTNIVNQVAFLRTSREFPEDLRQLTVEVNRAYIDTANAVNNRIISIFPTNRSAQNGETWFVSSNQRQNGFRQVYAFTGAGNVAHGRNLSQISGFVRCFGSFTDGTNWYGAVYAGSTAIAGQVTFYITGTNIVIVAGGGSPAIVSGTIVLEWIAKP